MAQKAVIFLAVIGALTILSGCAQTNFGLNVAASPGNIRVNPSLQTSSGNFTLSLGG